MNINHLDITFTSDCNLRCTYCPVSHPDYKSFNLKEDNIEKLEIFCQNHNVKSVQLSGHGETTLLPNWVDLVQKFTKVVPYTSMISNFARLFNEKEINALCKLSEIMVSIDTVDRDLLKNVRRKVSIENIVFNQTKVKAASQQFEKKPSFTWNAVVYSENIFSLNKWLEMGVACGTQVFILSSMTEYEHSRVTSLSNLNAAEKLAAVSSLRSLESIATRLGVTLAIQDGLWASLAEGVGVTVSDDRSQGRVGVAAKRHTAVQPSPEHTRLCMEPWLKARVTAEGNVSPCCFLEDRQDGLFGNLENSTLFDICDGQAYRNLQSSLISGSSLHPGCMVCRDKPWVHRDVLAKQLLNQGVAVDKPDLDALVTNNSMVSQARREAYSNAIDQVLNLKIPGDLIETGLWRGGLTALALNKLKEAKSLKRLFALDTFEGMVRPTLEDVGFDGTDAIEKFKNTQISDNSSTWCNASEDHVKSVLEKVAPDYSTWVTLVKGDVIETAPVISAAVESLAIARLDTDWYESTKAEVRAFYPKIAVGGFLLVDDYSDWQGSYRAINEYFEGIDRSNYRAEIIDGSLLVEKLV